MSEPSSTSMAPANHIQAAASWLATAAQPTKLYPPRNPSQLRISWQIRIVSL